MKDLHAYRTMHKGETLPVGTQRAIMRDAGITQDDLIERNKINIYIRMQKN